MDPEELDSTVKVFIKDSLCVFTGSERLLSVGSARVSDPVSRLSKQSVEKLKDVCFRDTSVSYAELQQIQEPAGHTEERTHFLLSEPSARKNPRRTSRTGPVPLHGA